MEGAFNGEPTSLLNSMLELIFVSFAVEMPLRFGNQPVLRNRPRFIAADTILAASTYWARVGAGKCPVALDIVALEQQVIHNHLKIRERGQEGLRHLGNCVPSYSWRVIVDTQRTVVRIECGHRVGG
jgi:hypothetical protein